MTAKLSFCLRAATTLQDRDLAALTDAIEAYTRAGMDTATAEKVAINDVLATVASDRKELDGLARKQHADLFKSDRAYPPKVAKIEAPRLSIGDQTDTPAFKAWFGDSKVVDADGKPQVVYHGTGKRFNKFNLKKATQGIIWFTNNRAEAEAGYDGAQGSGVVMDLYASIKNPAGWKEYDQLGLGELEARGYDGVILPERDGTLAGFVFDPKQLKSADRNRGTFDPNDADIRADFSGEPLPAAEAIETAPADKRSTTAMAEMENYFRQEAKGFENLRLTALPPVVRPLPSEGARKKERYAAQQLAEEVFNTKLTYFASNMQRFANGLAPHSDRSLLFVNENTRNPVMAVFGHELLHVMRAKNEALYQRLTDRLEGLLVQPGRYHDQFNARYEALGIPGLDENKVREELIADIVGDNFTDPEFWRALAKDQPNLFQRVLRAVLDFLDDVLRKLRDERPYGTAAYLKDVRAARATVADVLRDFAAVQRGEAGPTGLGAGANLSAANDVFYSELARQVEQATMKQAPASGWKEWLKGLQSKGVKPDEIAWTGIEDWLDLQAGKVTRDQVLEYLRENGVQVTEKVLDVNQDEFRDLPSAMRYLASTLRRSGGEVTEQDVRDNWSFKDEADYVTLANEMHGPAHPETLDGARYRQYTLPGGTNYREVLLTLPLKSERVERLTELPPEWQLIDNDKKHEGRPWGVIEKADPKAGPQFGWHADREGALGAAFVALYNLRNNERMKKKKKATYQSDHWEGVPNVLAHMRVNDRVDADGKKVLFIEEIQSDWAQDGKEYGFDNAGPIPMTREALIERLTPYYGDHQSAEGMADAIWDERTNLTTLQNRLEVDGGLSAQEANTIVEGFRTGELNRGLPRGPFVQKTDAWVALALKRAIKMAVDGGYDRVAIVNGQQSTDRYNLSTQVSELNYYPDEKTLRVTGLDGKEVMAEKVRDADHLSELVGKEASRKLLEQPAQESPTGMSVQTLKGDGLKIGGAGMKSFYDKIVPKVAKEVVRKLGGEGLTTFNIKTKQSPDGTPGAAWNFLEDASPQTGFDITDAMRQKAAAGVPLFSISGLTPPRETLARAFQRKFQDSFNRFTVIKNWAEKHGVNMRPDSNVWAYEERMHGRVATRVEDFREKRVKPAIEAIQKAGFTMEQVAEFLHAQHAEERNKQIATIDPQNAAGSGMKTADAQAIIAAADPKLVQLTNDFRKIADETRDILLKAGIIDQDMVDAWTKTYKHYVPLKGGDEEVAAQTGTGKGLNVAGKQKRAMGHDTREEFIVENLLRDHERAIALAEKNRVGHALLGFVADLAEPDIATIGQPEKRKVLQRTTSYEVREPTAGGQRLGIFDTLAGAKAAVAQSQQYGLLQGFSAPLIIVPVKDDPMVAYMASPQLAPNEVNVYVQGHAVRVQLNDERLAGAYTKSGIEQLNQLLAINRSINNFLSKAYTGYNPEFFFTNVIRDFTTGLINITSNFGAGVTARALAGYPKAFATLIRYSVTGKETPEIRDYRAAGGSTGSAYLADLDRVGRDVQNAYDDYRGTIATLRGRGAVAAGRVAARKMAGSVLGVLEHLNAAGESAMRLSVFQAVRNTQGYTEDDAASAAKNATVNFNRKGEWGPTMGALYLFFNPSIQGTATILDGLVNGKHRKQGWALAASLPALAYALAAGQFGGGDDDDDAWQAISDSTKDKNLIIRTGPKSYITIPVPYGYGFLFSLGNSMYALQKGKDVAKVALNVASNLLEHVSPIGNPLAGDKADTRGLAELVPGAIGGELMRDAVRLAVNRSSLGGDIVPDSPFDKEKPDHLRLFRSTKGSWYDRAASGLNELTGGTPATAGAADVSPETIKFWVRAITGGTGAFLADSANLGANAIRYAANPGDPDRGALKPEPGEIPIVRRFYKNETIGDRRRLFWEAVKEVETAKADLTRAQKMGDEAGEQSVDEKRGELVAMGAYTKAQVDLVKAQRDAVEEVMADTALTLAAKRARVKELEEEERSLYAEYVREFALARRDAAADRVKPAAAGATR